MTLQDGSKELNYLPGTIVDYAALHYYYIAEQVITMKYKKTKLVNYRQQRDNLNILGTCTFIDCDQYRTNYNGHIDITR